MKALVFYDSTSGNTARLAHEMAETLSDASALNVSAARPSDISGYELLIVGSPTQGGRPTSALMQFLGSVPNAGLKGTQVAAFDIHDLRSGTMESASAS